MALYHSTTKIIGRSSGKSAVAAAAYRSREKLHDERQGLNFDYSRKKDLGFSEIMLPENAPDWMSDRSRLWNAVEASEKRKDAQVAREIELALPLELTLEQQKELVMEYVRKNFVDRGMVADINIHVLENNPHVHIMLTTREIADNGFGKKVREWNDRNLVTEWRKNWADLQNEYLKRNGFDVTVDHRSYAERNVPIEPQIHLGALASMAPEKSKTADRMVEYRKIARENGELIIANPNLAFDHLTYHQATFTKADIWRFISSHSLDREQFQKARSAIENSTELVELGKQNGVTRYTTQAMLHVEQTIFENAQAVSEIFGHRVEEPFIQQAIRTRTLTDEQQQAFREMVSRNDLSSMIGRAGTGKSYTLDAVREAFEAQGYTVKGAALSGIAAEGLTVSSGIESRTVHRMLWDWDKGRGLLGPGSVLVIDEAGMLGTRQMSRIMHHVREAGAKVVLVGDYQQLQPVEAGGVFRGIVDRHGATELTDIRRQKSEWQKNATTFLSRGEIGKALGLYHAKGRIRTEKTFDDAKSELIREWSRHGQDETPLILACRKLDVSDLNRRAREVLKEAGRIGEDEQTFETVRGKLAFGENDRIMFLRNERSLGVKNGSLGTVVSVSRDGLLVKLDNGTTVAFDPKSYMDFDHGYATTVHKSQGATVDRSFILASRHFDRHMAYVALSRHREDACLYSSTDQNGFTDLNDMKTILGRTREKGLASDYAIRRGISADLDGAPFETAPIKPVSAPALVPDAIPKPVRSGNDFPEYDDDEIERFKKEINISEYAAFKGYVIDRSESFKNIAVMHSDESGDKIIISLGKDGHYVYFSRKDMCGGSIIDFVQRLEGKNLGKVRKELRPWIDENDKPIVAIQKYQKEISPPVKDREKIPQLMQSMSIAGNHRYLENERLISKETLKVPRFQGNLYVDQHGNAVFPNVDMDGLSGFELRNSKYKAFPGGDDQGIWVSRAYKGDERLVITQGAIDALSYHELFHPPKTRYVSIAENISRKQRDLIKIAANRMPNGSEIILATNNDNTGERLADELREIMTELTKERQAQGHQNPFIVVRNTPPTGNDWNEELKLNRMEMARQDQNDQRNGLRMSPS